MLNELYEEFVDKFQNRHQVIYFWAWLGPLIYTMLIGFYFSGRVEGMWGENDTSLLTDAIRAFANSGNLMPTSGEVYNNGYSCQAITAFVIGMTGLSSESDISQLQRLIYPPVAILFILPAWVTYRELTGSTRGATIAMLLLLTQPDFVFMILRGSHEKFTRTFMLLCIFFLARSFRLRHKPRLFAVHVALFYLPAFALASSNALLANSYFITLFAAMAIGLGQSLGERILKFLFDKPSKKHSPLGARAKGGLPKFLAFNKQRGERILKFLFDKLSKKHSPLGARAKGGLPKFLAFNKQRGERILKFLFDKPSKKHSPLGARAKGGLPKFLAFNKQRGGLLLARSHVLWRLWFTTIICISLVWFVMEYAYPKAKSTVSFAQKMSQSTNKNETKAADNVELIKKRLIQKKLQSMSPVELKALVESGVLGDIFDPKNPTKLDFEKALQTLDLEKLNLEELGIEKLARESLVVGKVETDSIDTSKAEGKGINDLKKEDMDVLLNLLDQIDLNKIDFTDLEKQEEGTNTEIIKHRVLKLLLKKKMGKKEVKEKDLMPYDMNLLDLDKVGVTELVQEFQTGEDLKPGEIKPLDNLSEVELKPILKKLPDLELSKINLKDLKNSSQFCCGSQSWNSDDNQAASDNPYAYIADSWVNIQVFFAVTFASWVLFFGATIIWAIQGLLWLWKNKVPKQEGAWLLWLLYGAFLLQVPVSIVADSAASDAGGNMLQRLLPSISMFAVGIAGYALAFWYPKGCFGWFIRFGLSLFVALVMVPGMLKVTNDPAVSNMWMFYREDELLTLKWADSHLSGEQFWMGFNDRLVASFRIAQERAGDDVRFTPRRNFFTFFNPRSRTRSFIISKIIRLQGASMKLPLPLPPDALLVYDNGDSQFYRLRPVSLHQR